VQLLGGFCCSQINAAQLTADKISSPFSGLSLSSPSVSGPAVSAQPCGTVTVVSQYRGLTRSCDVSLWMTVKRRAGGAAGSSLLMTIKATETIRIH